ncbi:hypothetical protein CCH79_00017398, partial [Gambusia affinis]
KGEIDGEQVSERQGSRAAVGDLPGEEPRVTLTLTRGTATAAGTVKGQKTALGRTGRHGSCRRDPGWLRTDGSNRNRGRGEAAFLQTGPTCLHFALTSGCYNYLTPAVDYAAVDSLIRSGQRPGSMWPDYRSESHLNAHLYSLMCCADERDRVQKKTFTKWVNKHLIKELTLTIQERTLTPQERTLTLQEPTLTLQGVRKHITDLYEDLRDGHNLISLLEVLSGVTLVGKHNFMFLFIHSCKPLQQKSCGWKMSLGAGAGRVTGRFKSSRRTQTDC